MQGQSQTIWFAEIKQQLAERWNSDLSMDEQFKLLADLNSKLHQIRIEYNVRPAMMWCPNCKERHLSRLTDISITAMHFALKRFEICSIDEFNELRKKWKKYSIMYSIDIFGKPVDKNGIDENKISTET